MRWLCALALIGACGGNEERPVGGVQIVLDIPNGPLDPKGFTSIEVVLHTPDHDTALSANLASDGTFDLGAIDPSTAVSVEATLRSSSGAALAYGRTATAAAFAAGSEIIVPVRRPIAYIAGPVGRDADGNANTADVHWAQSPATFADLSVGGNLDGRAQLAGEAVMMIAAGPSLYLVTQATSDPIGALIGPARVAPVSMTDHAVGAVLAGSMTGAVLDGAGGDDGNTLVIGTTSQLFVVDALAGTALPLAVGSFARVALVMTDTGGLAAVALRNRGATTGPCSVAAELWWAALAPVADTAAHLVATGGFTDIAADRGRAYYVDGCTGALGEVTADAATTLRSIEGVGANTDPYAGRPTALAVSNGKAYLGIETPPATTSLIVASVNNPDETRTLWIESAQQVVESTAFAGVQRQLDATAAVFSHLEVGAGDDYVALTTTAHFEALAVPEANFPDMTIDTEELRVFDAATGGVVQRYRSWCDGNVFLFPSDIQDWECSSTTGQTEAALPALEHHINSMTFLYGKK